jgi:hypothetical protein
MREVHPPEMHSQGRRLANKILFLCYRDAILPAKSAGMSPKYVRT